MVIPTCSFFSCGGSAGCLQEKETVLELESLKASKIWQDYIEFVMVGDSDILSFLLSPDICGVY